MRRILLRIALKLLDLTLGKPDGLNVDQEKLQKFLADCHEQPAFHDYFKGRDWQLLKAMGGGMEQREYLSYVGRRAELLYLLGSAKIAWDRRDKAKGKKT